MGGSDTCAACCSDCRLYSPDDNNRVVSVSEDEVDNYPACCQETVPDDSCPNNSGIDPKNNVMAYVSIINRMNCFELFIFSLSRVKLTDIISGCCHRFLTFAPRSSRLDRWLA